MGSHDDDESLLPVIKEKQSSKFYLFPNNNSGVQVKGFYTNGSGDSLQHKESRVCLFFFRFLFDDLHCKSPLC